MVAEAPAAAGRQSTRVSGDEAGVVRLSISRFDFGQSDAGPLDSAGVPQRPVGRIATRVDARRRFSIHGFPASGGRKEQKEEKEQKARRLQGFLVFLFYAGTGACGFNIVFLISFCHHCTLGETKYE